jgi:hypothetical protein
MLKNKIAKTLNKKNIVSISIILWGGGTVISLP